MARRRLTDPLAGIEVVPWDDFRDSEFRWEQGQHLTAVGPTGFGKSTLVGGLVHHRAQTSPRWHTTLIHTKPDTPGARRGAPASDKTISQLANHRDWHYLRKWAVPWDARSVILHPKWSPGSAHTKAVVQSCLEDVWSRGYMAVVADDVGHLCRMGMANDLRDYWQLGRAPGISLVSSLQRPAFVPLDCYSQATHVFFWRTNDDRDLKTIGGLNGVSSTTVREAVATLPKYQALYVNTDTGAMMRTTANQEVTQ